jgi:hypothetical protein
MINVYDNPLLLDFIRVCVKLPDDERAQLEQFTGHPFTVDGAAIGNYSAPGPKWVIKDDDEPVAIGGFVQERPGVWRDFMLTTPEAWGKHWFPVTRVCRRVMDAMLESGQAHRLECVTPASRHRVFRWYRTLGYTREGRLRGYCANGADAIIFSRVKPHGI